MAGKTFKQDVYVTSITEAGGGKVRVGLRSGDPHDTNTDPNAPPQARGLRTGEELTPLVMPQDDAPAVYEKMVLKLERRTG